MRMTRLAVVVSSVLLGSAVAYAGDHMITSDQFKAADKNHDGMVTVAEATAGLPTLGEHFKDVDTNGDGKISADELSSYNKSMEADQSTSPAPTK